MKINYNIALSGFMGCGKTTVGLALSNKLGLPFIDLDCYIEKQQKLTISKIFQEYGEEHFRKLESLAVKDISKNVGYVIALGGGTILSPQNVEVLKKTGKILFLNEKKETLQERLKNDKKRPLIKNKRYISTIFENRYEKYLSSADLIITPSKNVSETCLKIENLIKKTQPV